MKKNRQKTKTVSSIKKPPTRNILCKNKLKPKTIHQASYIRSMAENVMTFCHGPAGSGKTHIAIGLALEYLLQEKIEKIVITRPVVEAGEKLGFLPGTAEEKLNPYLLPLFDEINHFISHADLSYLKNERKISVVPLALMRGRSFHNSFIVADECQNASYDQLKMLLTRIGNNSKMVLTGDTTQSDLQTFRQGGFIHLMEMLKGLDQISMVNLECADIIRNPIISSIVDRIKYHEDQQS